MQVKNTHNRSYNRNWGNVCGYCGIEDMTIDNSAAYIQGWLKKLKSDNTFIVMASGLTQKAVDYILDHQDSKLRPVLSSKDKQKEKKMSTAM